MWCLWKLWVGATVVSPITDCEIWHSLAEFHHISLICNRAQRLGLMYRNAVLLSLYFQNHILLCILLYFYVSLEREIGLSSVNVMDLISLSPRTSFRPSFRNKIRTPKTRCRAPVEMCRFDKASKTHHSLSFSTAKRKYFILAYLERRPTLKHTLP